MVYHAAPLRYRQLRQATKLHRSVVGLVADEVSHYATGGPLELVSEVYAGMRTGKTYSPTIMKLYRAYGGL